MVTEAQRTEQAVTALIVLLLVVAGLLTLLTIWYWRHTSPKRRARAMGMVETVYRDVDLTAPPTEVYPVFLDEPPLEPRSRNLR